MAITPEEIESRRFVTALRGYDRAEVDAFLRAVADDLRGRAHVSVEPQPRAAAGDLVREWWQQADRQLDELVDLLSELQETLLHARHATEHAPTAAAPTDAAPTDAGPEPELAPAYPSEEDPHRRIGRLLPTRSSY